MRPERDVDRGVNGVSLGVWGELVPNIIFVLYRVDARARAPQVRPRSRQRSGRLGVPKLDREVARLLALDVDRRERAGQVAAGGRRAAELADAQVVAVLGRDA